MKVGIDLGSTYSMVARVDKRGNPQILPDSAFLDVYATPSIVYLGKEGAFVGHMVDLLLEQNPQLKVIRFFKRELGNNKPIYYDDRGIGWYAETISALVLRKLALDAENFSRNGLDNAVITVPAHFNDKQRKAVIHAAALADIPLLGLLEEPVAAALHYGVTKKQIDQVILVYDFGGGTFDASLVSMNEKGLYILAKDGLTELGGKEFDEELGQMILDQFKTAFGAFPELDAYVLLQLRKISEEVKIELCMPGKTLLRKIIILGNQSLEIRLNRRDFDAAIRKYIDQTIEITLRCVDEAGLRETDVQSVLMVGGTSLVPYISDRLKMIFNADKQSLLFHEPMKAVVCGAALHAHLIGGEASKYNLPSEFKGVTGYNVGIKTIDHRTGRIKTDTIIKRNQSLPAKSTRTYYTANERQTRIVLDIIQYHDSPDQSTEVGKMVIGPLVSPQQNYPVEVTILYKNDGTLEATAYDPSTGVELNKSFTNETFDSNHLLNQRQLLENLMINNFESS